MAACCYASCVVELLNPCNDLVFKLLFQRDVGYELLRSMLEAVIDFPSPIAEISILNPDIPIDVPGDKPIALDLHVDLANRARVDIEIQGELPIRTCERFLLYWAKDYAHELNRGQGYVKLVPVISVLWLQKNLISSAQFHSVFHVSEDTTRERFSNFLEIHTLELNKLHLLAPSTRPMLHRWARFFMARTREEFERLAAEDPTMDNAKKGLESVSMDTRAREMALAREKSLQAYYHEMITEREAGLAEGLRRGRAEGARVTLTRQLRSRFAELPAWALERLEHADETQLDLWTDAVITATSLEEALADQA